MAFLNRYAPLLFDLNSPPAIRMLDYLGDTGKYCTRSNNVLSNNLPSSEFLNITRDMVIDVGVCNLKSAASMYGILKE